MIQPIFIPINNSKSTCPHCHKDEDIVKTCRHCGHEYKDEDAITFIDIILILLILLLFFWILITILLWLIPLDDNPTLWEVIKMQWEWISSKRIF